MCAICGVVNKNKTPVNKDLLQDMSRTMRHRGPDGYGGVQVAPPEESLSLPGNNPPHPWWEVYQPVSYQLTSRMGGRAEFAAIRRGR